VRQGRRPRERGRGREGPLGEICGLIGAPFVARLELQRWALGAITTFMVAAFLCFHLLPPRVRLEVGERSPEEIKAPRTVTYVDTEATERLRQEAAAKVPPQFRPDREALREAERAIASVFEEARKVALLPEGSAKGKASKLAQRIALALPDEALKTLATSSPLALEQMEGYAKSLLRSIMGAGIRDLPGEMERARGEARRRAGELGLRPDYSRCVGELVAAALRPTLLYDPEATMALRREAVRRVRPVLRRVEAGEVVIREGEQVTQRHLDEIEALGLTHPRLSMGQIFASLLISSLAVFLLAAYLRKADPETFASIGGLSALSISSLLALGGYELLGRYPHKFLFSAGLGGAAASVLTTPRAGAAVALLLAALLAFVSPSPGLAGLASSISGLVGVCLASKVARRSDFLKVGGGLALANMAMLAGADLARGEGVGALLLDSAWGATYGALSALAVAVVTWLLERPLGLATQPRLLELTSPDHPLLRRLADEAPGTYHSSVLVSELAASASEAIGADPLLARVGALYHDIGKLKRPDYFVENQGEGENIHDRLNPTLSTKIVISHVRDGVELAKEHKLPPAVVDIIAQHHGTTLVQYFYHEAANGKGYVGEEEFRYPGPKPRSKEAAIVMLADSVEAAVRVMGEPTPAKLEGLVGAIVENRLRDGQLDESELTFRDLERIKEAFVRVLVGILHRRIPYPGQEGAVREHGEGGGSEARRRARPPKARLKGRPSGA